MCLLPRNRNNQNPLRRVFFGHEVDNDKLIHYTIQIETYSKRETNGS